MDLRLELLAVERLALFRQRVGLVIGNHLQTVLDMAEKAISRAQIVPRVFPDPAALDQRIERRQCLSSTQLGMTPSGDELLGLDEELDLADAATAELDVVTFDGDLLMTL